MVYRALGIWIFLGSALVSWGQEVVLEKWSGELNVPDPVAVSVDPKGRVYVAATTRRKGADLDIREHAMWIADDVGLDSVEVKRAFLQRELAPGKLRVPRGGLKDHNKDGSIDWKDLTVHSERIYQLRDTDGDGKADKMTVFAEGFNSEVTGIAAGILYHDGWVYVTVAPDVWRLKDTDDDGVADVREVVATGFGMHIAYAGHDMHGLRLGVDGRIYWSIGDKGVNVTSKEGKQFYYPHEGCVLRMEPDGTGFEVFAHGLRNVQEVAFDAWGNVFGVDNDADLTGEKERVVRVVEGSDAGWRCGHQYMKTESRWMREGIWQTAHAGQPLFVTPPLALSRNGPAGFLWEPGTALGKGLRGKFLLNQFPSGEMSALTIEAKGASFEQTAEVTVSRGVMGIGMAWGAEGAAYMADWSGGYPLDEQGAVWKVDAKAGRDEAVRKEVLALLKGEFKGETVEALAGLLGHADQRVRVGAQLELVKRGAWGNLVKVAVDVKAGELARCHAVWGLGMGMRRGLCGGEEVVKLVGDGSARVREQVAKVMGDAVGKKGVDGAVLVGLLADEAGPVRVQAAMALGKLRFAGAVGGLVAMAERDGADPVLRHAVVMGLAGCAEVGELAGLAKAESMGVRAAGLLALRQLRVPEVAVFLADAEPGLVEEAVRAIHDDAGVPEAWGKLAALMDEKRVFSEMTWRRVMNAAYRVGGAENALRVLGFALDETRPIGLREEAFRHLAEWVEVPRLDRVDGMVHDLSKRDASGADEAALERVGELLALKESSLKSAAILMLVALKVPVAAEAMVTMIGDKAAPDGVRAEALKLMAAQHGDKAELDAVLAGVWSGKAPVVLKEAALGVTAEKRPALLAERVGLVLAKEKDLGLKQEALRLSGSSREAAMAKVVMEWMAMMPKGKVPMELRLDVLEAATALGEGEPALKEAVAAYEAARPAPVVGANGLPVMPLPKELLKGGSVARGKEVVTNHLGGNCLACHVVEATEGSNVGPRLTGIGKLKPREYVLEALLQPGAVVAPGYGMVSVTMKDGKSVSGTVLAESAEMVKVRAVDGAEVEIKKGEIAVQTPAISVMPPMLGILTKGEVRDVVAYLMSLTKLPKKVVEGGH
jgi:quinoprotein glucose dehydrogenase